MKELGIDISSQKSKIITEDMIKSSAKSVDMGCIEKAECPMPFMNNVIDWVLEIQRANLLKKSERLETK